MTTITSKRAAFTKKEVWIERVRESVNGCTTDIAWCRAHGINASSFQVWKMKLQRQGILSTLYDWADGFYSDSHPDCSVLTRGTSHSPVRVHFITQKVSRVSFDLCYWTIRTSLKMNPDSGDYFVFLRADKQTLYTFRKGCGGYCFSKSSLEHGFFHWPSALSPQGLANITKFQLAQILEMAGIPSFDQR